MKNVVVLFVASFAFIADLAAQTQPWRVLFDGRALTNWEGNSAMWRIADGSIVGGTLDKPILKTDHFCTVEEFDDFDLQLRAGPHQGWNECRSELSQSTLARLD